MYFVDFLINLPGTLGLFTGTLGLFQGRQDFSLGRQDFSYRDARTFLIVGQRRDTFHSENDDSLFILLKINQGR